LRDFDSCSWTIDPEYTIEAPDLRKTMHTFFPRPLIERQAKLTGFQQRSRKLDVYSLTVATVLTTGSDDSGRQADIYAAYLDNVGQGDEVVRSSFYAWPEFRRYWPDLGTRPTISKVRRGPALSESLKCIDTRYS